MGDPRGRWRGTQGRRVRFGTGSRSGSWRTTASGVWIGCPTAATSWLAEPNAPARVNACSWLTPPAGDHLAHSPRRASLFGDLEPAVSPDGRSIASLAATVALSGELHLLPFGADMQPAGEPRKLVATRLLQPVLDAGWPGDPLPRGHRLAQNRPGAGAAPARSSRPWAPARLIPLVVKPAGWPSRRTRRHQYLAAGTSGHGGTRRPRRLIASTADDQDARYSPDGARIVFQSTGPAGLKSGSAAAMALTARKSPT